MLKMTLIALAVMAALLAAVPNIIWVVCYLVGLCFNYHMPYAPFGWSAAVLVCIFVLIMLYGIYIGRFQMEINRQEFCSAEVPEHLDGYKIVHISDLHLSTFDDRPQALQRVVDSINALNPNAICFTGDLVSLGVEEVKPYTKILQGLKAKDGVFSVLGNHDFMIYNRGFNTDAARLAEVEKLANFERDTLGWHLLRNSNYHTESNITFAGVDNSSCTGQGFKTIYAGDLQAALNGISGFCVLLSHDPSHWRAEVAEKEEITLTLSGHTHAGQVRLFSWPLSSVSFQDNEGWYYAGKNALYINRGVGCTAPIRISCPQEITLITLHKASY